MKNSSWIIPRRTFLRGLGVAVALPMLDIMTPLAAQANEPNTAASAGFTSPKKPVRLMMMNLPCGTYRKEWGVDQPGPINKFKPMLEPLQAFASDITLFSNLWNKAATADSIAHYANEQLWTSTVVKKTTGADLNAGGVSVDQFIARQTASVTRFPSINLGMMAPVSGTDSGWSRVYNNQLSWSTPTTPVPNEIDPKRAFGRLFRYAGGKDAVASGGIDMGIPEEARKSVLDKVMADANTLRTKASVADQRKLDEYLTAVRDVEQQIEREIAANTKERPLDPAATRAVGELGGTLLAFDGRDHTKRLRLMLDLAVLAFWTDSTRVATFIFGHERNDLNYSFIDGVKSGHHESSHHGESAEKLDYFRRINLWHAEQVAYLLERMKNLNEPDGTSMLDNSLVFWGGALNDGNNHGRENLPILLAGKGGGGIKPGRHLELPKKTPLANLYLSLFPHLGVKADSFADSTGIIDQLTA